MTVREKMMNLQLTNCPSTDRFWKYFTQEKHYPRYTLVVGFPEVLVSSRSVPLVLADHQVIDENIYNYQLTSPVSISRLSGD